MAPRNRRATIYVCEHHVCRLPTPILGALDTTEARCYVVKTAHDWHERIRDRKETSQ
jgi:hypothetical protein